MNVTKTIEELRDCLATIRRFRKVGLPKGGTTATEDRIARALPALLRLIEGMQRELAEARDLIQRAETCATVTMSDEPGCFFCDREGEHTEHCEAAKWLGRNKT